MRSDKEVDHMINRSLTPTENQRGENNATQVNIVKRKYFTSFYRCKESN